MSQEVAEMTQKVKDKDDLIDKLRVAFRGYEPARQNRLARLQHLRREEQSYRPSIDFLMVSRSFPMYLEDLSSRVRSLRRKKCKCQQVLKSMNGQIEELRRARDGARAEIAAKCAELRTYQGQVQSATDRVQQQSKDIERRQKALDEAGQRLEQECEQTRRFMTEHAELDRQALDMRHKFDSEMADIDRCQAEFEAGVAAARNSKEGEVSAYEDRIQKLRHKITFIRERDADPDIPAIDVDLRRQVERVRAYQQDLVRESERCDEEVKQLELEIKQKTWDLQTLVMKTQPTPGILASSVFHEKFVLLKELVLQNLELKMETAALSERALALRTENNAMRKRLGGIPSS
jgi:chromosome segregation ATPase